MQLACLYEGLGWHLEAFALRQCGEDPKKLKQLLGILRVYAKYSLSQIQEKGDDDDVLILKSLSRICHGMMKRALPPSTKDSYIFPRVIRYEVNPMGFKEQLRRAVETFAMPEDESSYEQ